MSPVRFAPVRVVLGTAVLLLALCGCDGRSVPSAKVSAPHRPTANAPVVFVLGDRYTVGTRDVSRDETYAADLARALKWQVVVAGRAQSGFVNRVRYGHDLAQQFSRELAWRPAPDMVIVAGGHNDVGHPLRKVGAAASSMFRQIHAQWPRTPVVAVGPMNGGTPTKRLLRTRDQIRRAARVSGVHFVDPLAGRWITGDPRRGTGNSARYVAADRVDPSTVGQHYLADRMAIALKRLHLTHP